MNKPYIVRNRRGFTLIELLVVITIISILLAILLPALAKARMSAEKVKCMTHLNQMYKCFACYAMDYKGYWPPVRKNGSGNDYWYLLLFPYTSQQNVSENSYHALLHKSIFRCPSVSSELLASNKPGYGLNGVLQASIYGNPVGDHLTKPVNPLMIPSYPSPSQWPLVADKIGFLLRSTSVNDYNFIHMKSANILFCDGHVSSVKKADYVPVP